MWNPALPLLEFWDQYHGLIIGFAALGAVLLVDQWIYRRSWKSCPSLDDYLAAHPGCRTPDGVVCNACPSKALVAPVARMGRIYRCGWCDTELYRIDRA